MTALAECERSLATVPVSVRVCYRNKAKRLVDMVDATEGPVGVKPHARPCTAKRRG